MKKFEINRENEKWNYTFNLPAGRQVFNSSFLIFHLLGQFIIFKKEFIHQLIR
jgi:hypothetical protein